MKKKIIEVIEFTDPVCSWCWGSEPVLRKLETLYKGNIKISFVMGGMVEDIRDFRDSNNGIGGDPELSNQNIASHWLEASGRHKMPVNAQDFHLFSNEHPSTYPLNIAYCAVKLEDEELANEYLRLLREETIANGRLTNRKEVLVELANDIGVDIVEFINALDNGSAEALFNYDLKFAYSYRVMGFPTFLIRYDGNELLLRGYQSFERMNAVINLLTKGEISQNVVQASENEVIAFVSSYRRVAPVEIETVFNITAEEAQIIIEKLVKKQVFKKTYMGNGFLISIQDDLICDPVTGICTSI